MSYSLQANARRVDKEKYKHFKMWCVENDTDIKDALEEAMSDFLKKKGK